MTVILSEDVAHLGQVGDVVSVREGYGRNFLVPRGLAIPASSRNLKVLEHQKTVLAGKRQKLMKAATEVAKKLADTSVTLARKAGDEDKLFGSVTNRDVADALALLGYKVDKRHVVIETPIKNLGVYTVDVKLHANVGAKVKVYVVAE
ncbi:MAG: 50S ribosomal protein L9 [Myxococcales bacterium]|nr:50S ribosomal protein L9 [Myxococcales bacterium]